MELKLVSGDYVPDGCGGFVRQKGSDALYSQALFRLICRRGSFPFLPELGSELWKLGSCKPQAVEVTALAYAAAAVEPMGLRVTRLTAKPGKTGAILLQIWLSDENNTVYVEVTQ